MRSRYLTALVFAVAMSLVFVSCDSFFNTNLFKSAGLGQVSAEKLKGESSAELVDDAYTDSGDPSLAFFDALAGDTTVKGEVLATLAATYTATTNPAEVQEAASLAAQIEIVTTGGDELVNNLAKNLQKFQSLSTVEGAIDLVSSLVPAGLAADESSFAAAIGALLSSNDAFDALGTSMLANGPLIAGTKTGTAAQSAFVAAALEAVVVPVANDPETGAPYTSTAAYLWDIMKGTQTQYPSSFSLNTSASTPLGSILAGADLSIPPISL